MKQNIFYSLALFFIISVVVSCNTNSVYTSKKRGYFNIQLPEHQYVNFDSTSFPYSFEYPVYARLERDSSYFGEDQENDYWINVDFPKFNATLFLSYKIIGDKAIYKVKQPDG
ncbi:MAG: hypothetical protein FGM46_01310, partial [Ferruginibacter sp.]|nr:hypothetical protein [Ferruginibacter sp.]